MTSTSPKTVIIVTPWFMPAYKAGGPVQSILQLVSNYHHVHYKIFCSHADLDNTPLNIPANQWVRYNAHTLVWYDNSFFPMIHLKKELNKNPSDILYINGFFSFHFNILPLLFIKNDFKIISPRGMLHPGALHQKSFKKFIYLQFLRKVYFLKKIVFHATNQMEKEFIENSLGNQASVKIANNFFRKLSKINHTIKKPGTLKLVTTAIISPMKNHLLVIKALKENKNDISYHIIGAIKDKSYWLDCLHVIDTLPKNIQVFYHGDIHPDKIHTFYTDSSVLIMVSESENFGHSIAECLSAGIPVITTTHTPWQQLQSNHAGMLVTPTIYDINNAIEYFSQMNDKEYKKYAENAYTLGMEQLNHVSLIKAYDQLFNLQHV